MWILLAVPPAASFTRLLWKSKVLHHVYERSALYQSTYQQTLATPEVIRLQIWPLSIRLQTA